MDWNGVQYFEKQKQQCSARSFIQQLTSSSHKQHIPAAVRQWYGRCRTQIRWGVQRVQGTHSAHSACVSCLYGSTTICSTGVSFQPGASGISGSFVARGVSKRCSAQISRCSCDYARDCVMWNRHKIADVLHHSQCEKQSTMR